MESILSILGIFFLPIIMVIIIVYFRSREQRAKHKLQAELYAKALELGKDVPADLFAQEKHKKNPLHTGIILISVGIGITLFIGLAEVDNLDVATGFSQGAALGVIPFFIGLGYLLIYFLDKKQASPDEQR
jgi:purine-cytosine permease-like protein